MISKKAALFFSALLIFLSGPVFSQENAVPVTAPFTTDATAPKENGSRLMAIYDTERAVDVVPLDKPHRTTEQVATWIEEYVTTAMNIDATKWDAHLQKIKPSFDPYGLQEYQKYLDSSGILNLLKTNGLKLNAIVEGGAVLLSQGALSGTYHWLYDVPLMLTYYDQDMTSLKESTVRPQNQKVSIRVQIGRVHNNSENGLFIERWSVVPAR